MIRHGVYYSPDEPPSGGAPPAPSGVTVEVAPDVNDWASFARSGMRPGDVDPVANPEVAVAPVDAVDGGATDLFVPPAPPAAPSTPAAPVTPTAGAPLAPEPLILGKFKTLDEALAGFNTLQEEKATLEKLLAVSRTSAAPSVPRASAPAAAPPAPVGPAFMVTKEQVAGLYERPEEVLSALGSGLYQQAVRDTLTLVDEYINERERLQNYAKTSHAVYYERHKHHRGREKFVGAIAREVQAENPGKWPHELIDDIARRVDGELAKMGIATTPAAPPAPSAPPPPGGARPTMPKQTEQEKEMADLLH